MIFYFSGTGNSRWAAKRIADSTGDHLVFIPDVIDSPCEFTIGENESAWLIFPVHGWRPPRLIRQFVGKLTIQSSNPTIHALCTAGDSIGKTMEILEGDLKKRGIRLGKTYSLIMPESYVGLPFMDVDTKEREQEKIKKAAEELERIVAPSGAEGVAPTLHRGPIPWFFSGPVGAFFVNRLVTDKHFHVVEDRCIKCGKCAEACPVGDIEGGKGQTPEWLHNGRCLTCFACYHHCPTHAIEFGNRTKNKGQYFFGKMK